MKSEFALAFNEIAEHSKLKREIILDALENAMVTAYRKAVNASAAQHVVAKVDPATGGIKVYAEKEVVDDVQEPNTEVALPDARQVDPEAQLGDMVTEYKAPEPGQTASSTYEGEGWIIVRHPETARVEAALDHIVRTVRVEMLNYRTS